MSENPTPQNVVIDASKMEPTQRGEFTYAMHARKHLSRARVNVMDALGAEIINAVGAQLMTELIDSVDRAILKDIAHIAGVHVPEGHALLEAIEVTHDPRKAS